MNRIQIIQFFSLIYNIKYKISLEEKDRMFANYKFLVDLKAIFLLKNL